MVYSHQRFTISKGAILDQVFGYAALCYALLFGQEGWYFTLIFHSSQRLVLDLVFNYIVSFRFVIEGLVIKRYVLV